MEISKEKINDKITLYNCNDMKKDEKELLISCLERLLKFTCCDILFYHHKKWGARTSGIRLMKPIRPSGDPHAFPEGLRENVELVIPVEGGVMNFYVFDG